MNPFDSDEDEDIDRTSFYKKEQKIDLPDHFFNQFLDFNNKYINILNNFETRDQIHMLKTNPELLQAFHKVFFLNFSSFQFDEKIIISLL